MPKLSIVQCSVKNGFDKEQIRTFKTWSGKAIYKYVNLHCKDTFVAVIHVFSGEIVLMFQKVGRGYRPTYIDDTKVDWEDHLDNGM